MILPLQDCSCQSGALRDAQLKPKVMCCKRYKLSFTQLNAPGVTGIHAMKTVPFSSVFTEIDPRWSSMIRFAGVRVRPTP